MIRVRAAMAAVVTLGAIAVPAPGAATACSLEPSFSASVTPPGEAILGFPDRRATTQEINGYVQRVATESPRVIDGVFAHSWNGTALEYAIVGTKRNIARLPRIVEKQQRLRDPRRTGRVEAARIARRNPAIVWYSSNVHGGETSGADAAVQILYELAARTDCAVRLLLRNLVVGIIPIQNPDGRDTVSRTNDYSFDMNRDWFAWTQPETRGKITLLRDYPPVLYIDAHEMGSSNFFFPPNADPIHHEVSDQSIHWINDLYGRALARAFEARQQDDPTQWDYFNYDIYDLLYMGYGDSMPTTAFTAAGMTFEKGIADTDRQRETEQFVAGWTSLRVAAKHKRAILADYYEAHRQAMREGAQGRLEPNRVFQEGSTLVRKVPRDRVGHYFIDPTRAEADAGRVIDRLLTMDVEIYRLGRDLRVRNLRHYGRVARPGVVPAGSYWIPMKQPQKRWIQAMLGEDPYVPFPYFYDVTAWSLPLLASLDASFTGDRVRPRRAERVLLPPRGGLASGALGAQFFWFAGETARSVAAAFALVREGHRVERLPSSRQVGDRRVPKGTFVVPNRGAVSAAVRRIGLLFSVPMHASIGTRPGGVEIEEPRIAVYQPAPEVGPARGLLDESLGHLRWLLDQELALPVDLLSGVEVAAGALTLGEYDAFIVPGVTTADLTLAQEQIRLWIEGGGTFIGTARPGGTGGTPFAVSAGYTTATLSDANALQVPGTMFRVALNRASPLAWGARRHAYWFHLGEQVLSPTESGRNVARFPRQKREFWFSGYAAGERALKGSAGLVEETLGAGRVVLFSGEPNFRGFTDGTAFLLANVLAYPTAAPPAGTDVGDPAVRDLVRLAMASAGEPTGPGRPIRIEVPAEETPAALVVLERFTNDIDVFQARGSAFLEILNPAGLAPDEHPYSRRLLPALLGAGIEIHSAIL
ncbi:MAG: M14 family zinc carboxypeptidase [Actinomycetota bacterium]